MLCVSSFITCCVDLRHFEKLIELTFASSLMIV